uniref:Nucleoporin NUP188 n=1 Tax=Anthurium amnicola TaxID=1678845 RepID=A0A1D1YTL0_9ARAE
MASATDGVEQAAQAKPVDESLWWDSFVLILEQLENASSSPDISSSLVKKLKSNHAWFLDSLSRFKPPNATSRLALDSPEISFGQKSLRVKLELREIALLVSSSLCLDEVQSYILVNRSIQLESSLSDRKRPEFLHSILIQYYLERQCLLKCIRWLFMQALYIGNVSHESVVVWEEALLLVDDGLENKLFTILKDLLYPASLQKREVDLIALWVEESLIECNLVLDIFFLAYYENFCNCNSEQWESLCLVLKGIVSGSFNIGKLAASSEAKKSFYHANVQLLLILIETLDLENLLKMVHDDVPFRDSSIFSLMDIQRMDSIVSSLVPSETVEVGPLILAWAVFLYLLLSLPDKHDYHFLMEIDYMGYVHNAVVCAPFGYLMEILQYDFIMDSDGPVSGYRSVLKTFISAFIASFELAQQSESDTSKMILDILCKIYRGEESLCVQFWDRNSFIDEPIRSLLYSLKNDFPFNMVELVRLLSALCEGSWPAECVFNFLCSMDHVNSLYDIRGNSYASGNNEIVETPNLLHVEGFDLLTIPSGTQGHVLKVIDDNTAIVQWKCAHSGVSVLLLRLAEEFHSNSYEDIYLTLDLFYRMVLFNTRLCFALMAINQSSMVQSAQPKGDVEKNAQIDLAKVVCSLVIRLVRGSGHVELVSLCINILVEMLKCVPSHVVELTLKANIFGMSFNGSSSGLQLLSGGLAKMVVADYEQNVKSCSLTVSVLDFTLRLVEVGADDDMVSSLVVFSLQYILVNHENWSYKFRYARWKVTQKVFEVMKSCVKASQTSSKLSCLIREILLCDSSIHTVLFRAFCMRTQVLEGLYVSRLCDLREVEGLQVSVCLALDVVFAMLKDLLKDTSSGVPVFVQSVLSSTNKPIPVITAVASLISFFRYTAIQVAAARVLSMLCFVSAWAQPYSSENAFSVLDEMQIKELSCSIYEILIDEEMKSEDLLISVVNLLVSAARFQPAFLVSIILSMDYMESPSNNADGQNHQVVIAPAVVSSDSTRSSPLNSIMQYVKRSENLAKRSPRLLLSIINFIKALWNRNVQYMQILEIFRRSESFWEKMSWPIRNMEAACSSAEIVNDDEMLRLAYRYQFEAAILEIIAHDIFLHKRVLQDEMFEKQRSRTEMPKGGITCYPMDILSKWCESSTLESRIKLYSSVQYPEEIIHRAKVEVILCVVHMIVNLSIGDAGSLSLSLVQKILTAYKKLTEQPPFLALLQQYSMRGYSEGNEANIFVLTDLYYHIQGELEGRVIAPGHFKELFQYLLEQDIFQHYECKYDRDLWPLESDMCVFDVTHLRIDLGIELWDHSDWKRSKSVVERMLSLMHQINSVKFLAYSKNSSLRAFTCLLCVYMRNSDETQPNSLGDAISEPLLRSSIEHLCQCLQTAKDSLLPAMSPSEESLKFLATQVELLLSLFKSLLISYWHATNVVELLPVCLLLIRTSDKTLRLLSDVRQSTILHSVVNLFLTLLLTSIKSIYPISLDKFDSEVDLHAEASLLSLGLLPVLCKYTETSVHSNLSVAAMDSIIKGFLAPNTWLPVLQSHLHLQPIIHKLRQQDRLSSVPIILKFLLTLARTKGGAEMLHTANVFQSLKVLLTHFVKDELYSSNTEGFAIGNATNDEKDLKHIWGLGLAITASMMCSLGDGIASIEFMGNAIHYFFFEKASLMYYHLSFPKFSGDDHSQKKARIQKSQTYLTALKETEYALILTCMLAKHQNLWLREMKEMESELRETIIHMLGFISKVTQRVGDSPNRAPPLLCPPILKKEITLYGRPSFVESKHGWFTLAALGSVPQYESSTISSTHLSMGTENQANQRADFHKTYFSDIVAVQIYRIAFLLLKFLCTQARVATKRAEEVGYIDLAHFPELPMPETLHGIQDQSISIIVDICLANRSREIQPESQFLCHLLLQILEKSLYLELCVSHSCGIRPVSGRIEDFSKEIKMLMRVADECPSFKVSLKPLKQIIALVYPGILQISSIL